MSPHANILGARHEDDPPAPRTAKSTLECVVDLQQLPTPEPPTASRGDALTELGGASLPTLRGADLTAPGGSSTTQPDTGATASPAHLPQPDPSPTRAVSGVGSSPTLSDNGAAACEAQPDPTATTMTGTDHTYVPVMTGVSGLEILNPGSSTTAHPAAAPAHCPSTCLQQGIIKPKMYTDGTVRWCNLTTTTALLLLVIKIGLLLWIVNIKPFSITKHGT
jgi:hypothetical protein